tara:strand:+ start:166 stop:372 length:207 start_codon:yes stop_codon:yes gene_type:complete
MKKELEKFIGKKIAFHYSDYDKKIMGLPQNYVEIFIGERIVKEDGTYLLYNDQDQYVNLEYAIKNQIK